MGFSKSHSADESCESIERGSVTAIAIWAIVLMEDDKPAVGALDFLGAKKLENSRLEITVQASENVVKGVHIFMSDLEVTRAVLGSGKMLS